ncbi:hypothetical protein E2P81_ATG06848 [Venturia nashicola]|nr:hypothetical protein E2P81_ATG06848 [Venturia nashicola]
MDGCLRFMKHRMNGKFDSPKIRRRNVFYPPSFQSRQQLGEVRSLHPAAPSRLKNLGIYLTPEYYNQVDKGLWEFPLPTGTANFTDRNSRPPYAFSSLSHQEEDANRAPALYLLLLQLAPVFLFTLCSIASRDDEWDESVMNGQWIVVGKTLFPKACRTDGSHDDVMGKVSWNAMVRILVLIAILATMAMGYGDRKYAQCS